MEAMDTPVNGKGDGTISKSFWKDRGPSRILTLNPAQRYYYRKRCDIKLAFAV